MFYYAETPVGYSVDHIGNGRYPAGMGDDNHALPVLVGKTRKNFTENRNRLITGKQLLEVALAKTTEIQREVRDLAVRLQGRGATLPLHKTDEPSLRPILRPISAWL